MCQPSVTVGKVEFGPEQRQEIDWRIQAKLAEREYFRGQYVRGISDCLYAILIVAMLAYSVYLMFWKEE